MQSKHFFNKTLFTLLTPLLFITFITCNCGTTGNSNKIGNFSSSFSNPQDVPPRYSFVGVERVMHARYCENGKCEEGDMGGFGSGTIIYKDGNTGYILTANHVCVNTSPFPPGLIILSTEMLIYDINKKEYKAKIVNLDAINDLCILKVDNIEFKSLKIASSQPKIGDRVINIAAPGGFFEKNLVPIYDGIYIGNMSLPKEKRILSVYTTHAYPGSSGSMIINYNGEVVGLLHSVIGSMQTIAFSPTTQILKDFVVATVKIDCLKCKL